MVTALALEIGTPNGVGTHLIYPETALGLAAAHPIFTIAGGPILILAYWGICITTLMDGTASTLRLEHSVGNTNICGDLAAIANDPIGTMYYIAGIQATLMLQALAGTAGMPTLAVASLTPIPAIPGTIDITNGGDQTGTIEHHLVYQPLDPLSTVIITVPYV